jgi:glucose-6-phosphate isomerase
MNGRTLAEAEAEMRARGMADGQIRAIAPHRVFDGNRPSNTFLYRKLTPFMLGMLIALYEHKVFVQGAVWDINSFDQWGVELGKVLAVEIEPLLAADDKARGRDSSTIGLIEAYKALRQA